jgi:hypothetical protein
MAGMMSITGEPGREPQKAGVAISDIFTGLYSVIAIQAALRHAEKTGEGQMIDMALFDTQAGILGNQNLNYLVSGVAPVQMGNAHMNIAPYEVFPVSDGHVIIAVGNDGQFQRFCKLLGATAWRRSRVPDQPSRVAHRERLRAEIIAAMSTWTKADMLAACEANAVPAGPINNIAEMFDDPQAIARGLRMDLTDQAGTEIPSVRAPILLPASPLRYDRPSPRLGEHTEDVLERTRTIKTRRKSTMTGMRTGGQLIVDALKANGVERLFCVPGESYLAVLDALVDSGVGVTVCRQEGGAAMMADAWGRLTGKPGICFVTRGPGATNATAGLHIARQDSIPMVLFIGQVQRDAREREAFQEVEYRRAFTEFAKWVGEIDDPARIPEFVNRAFSVASPAVPDRWCWRCPRMCCARRSRTRPPGSSPNPVPAIHPGAAQMRDLGRTPVARRASGDDPRRHPLDRNAVRQVERFAERAQIPVGCSFRRQMLFDHPIPAMPAMSASASTRRWPKRSKIPIWCCWSAGASPKCPPPATR